MVNKTRSNAVTLKEIRQAIKRSGYLLESRIESHLVSNGYYVEANSAYPDPNTGKSRELDLYGMSGYKLTRDYDFLFSVLLIECINNPQPIVFFTKEPLGAFLNIDALKLAGLPAKIYSFEKEKDWISLQDFMHFEKFHHYCKGRIATQFCSFSKKRGTEEWMASQDETHFEAFSKLCDATEYQIDKHFKSWVFNTEQEPINIEFYHPVLVVQGRLIDARPICNGVKLIETDYIQFRRTTIKSNEAEDYQIDVMTERYFPVFLDLLYDEFTKITNSIKRKKKLIRKSIDKIVSETKRLKSPDMIRKSMEF
jgi:hypothetical protein